VQPHLRWRARHKNKAGPGLRSRRPSLPRAPAAGGASSVQAASCLLSASVVAKFMFAGGVGCSISHAVATPLDVIKTRQQFDPSRYLHRGTGKKLGVVATGLRISAEEGPAMLLQGLGTTTLAYLLQGAVKYGSWEVFKFYFGYFTATGCGKILALVAASSAAETVASVLLCPFERARIKLVSDPRFAMGTRAALRRLRREEGFLQGFYGPGFTATLAKQLTYTIAKLTTFTLVMEALCAAQLPRVLSTLVGSVAAGFFSAIASQPWDTLQICTSADSALRENCPIDLETGGPPTSLWALAKAMGFRGLFTGCKAKLIQTEVICVTQLLIYDAIKSWVGL